MALEDFQWTLILGLIGLIIGLILPSGLGILANYDYSQVAKDPVKFITGYVVAGTTAVIIEVFSAAIGALIGGIIGIIVDGIRVFGNSKSYY